MCLLFYYYNYIFFSHNVENVGKRAVGLCRTENSAMQSLESV